MTARIPVQGDLSFVRTLLGAGAADLKYCYQCSTCTVVCPITPAGSPFPRKEMIQAQFGMKDRLVAGLDSWLCIHCNDCSTHCPRGARPGDVMNVLRALSIEHFSVPGVIARAARSVPGVLLLLLIPAVILGAVIAGLHAATGFGFLEGEIVFSRMLPVPVVDAIFIPAAAFAALTLALALTRFLRAVAREHPRTAQGAPLASAMLGAAGDILSQRKFRECGTNRPRARAHVMAMYGFLGLVVTTTLVAVFYYLNLFGLDVAVGPYGFFHPIKMLGNASGTLVLLGCILVVARRMTRPDAGRATDFDRVFVWVLFLTVLTGFLAQMLRVSGLGAPAYSTYFVHLVFVFFLLAYAGYTKMAHVFFRTAAMVYARWSGRALPDERHLP
jgi:quinone-modifying oxidoreductase, subunit QmoC